MSFKSSNKQTNALSKHLPYKPQTRNININLKHENLQKLATGFSKCYALQGSSRMWKTKSKLEITCWNTVYSMLTAPGSFIFYALFPFLQQKLKYAKILHYRCIKELSIHYNASVYIPCCREPVIFHWLPIEMTNVEMTSFLRCSYLTTQYIFMTTIRKVTAVFCFKTQSYYKVKCWYPKR